MYDDVELHSAFVNSMLTQTMSDSFVVVPDMDARLEVYRRNFMQGYCNTLQKTYAMTALYLGDSFTKSAVLYICQQRPKAGQLFATYGESFSSILQDPIAKALAKLEWGLQSVMMAAADGGQKIVDPDQIYWQLRSDVRLLQTDYNVGEVYGALKTRAGARSIAQGCYYYILRCAEAVPTIESISREEYVVLDLLQFPHRADDLFAKLTFSKEIVDTLLPKVFNSKLLKVIDGNNFYLSEVYSNI